MATNDYREESYEGSSRSSTAWLYAPVILILFLGGAMSIGAYVEADPQLTITESIALGFGGLAALVVAMIAALLAVVASIFAAVIALVAAGGAVGVTLFIVASPIIAIILIAMLFRRRKSDCPNPAAHE